MILTKMVNFDICFSMIINMQNMWGGGVHINGCIFAGYNDVENIWAQWQSIVPNPYVRNYILMNLFLKKTQHIPFSRYFKRFVWESYQIPNLVVHNILPSLLFCSFTRCEYQFLPFWQRYFNKWNGKKWVIIKISKQIVKSEN